mmetsp:Transcript_40113/g.114657  ORF Transcript_40113/g.114657 Transcript_40113/m.114657 type:complete len:222 (+) Transcript_40113:443-1108(+)
MPLRLQIAAPAAWPLCGGLADQFASETRVVGITAAALVPERPQLLAKDHCLALGAGSLLVPPGHELLQPGAKEERPVVGIVIGREVFRGLHHARQRLDHRFDQDVWVHQRQRCQVHSGVALGPPAAVGHPALRALPRGRAVAEAYSWQEPALDRRPIGKEKLRAAGVSQDVDLLEVPAELLQEAVQVLPVGRHVLLHGEVLQRATSTVAEDKRHDVWAHVP